MRMGRVNISMPDELIGQARAAGVNVSQLAQGAVSAELVRLAKRDELDRYLQELEHELGPTSKAERAAAAAWADQVLGSGPPPHTA
jgi:hypothetical protein